ncbi:MAG: YceI family protein [Ignavibacteriae bacterium]|nr:YceI family protein [Ignavibacteria bacterium]MBI3363871.1 YceI family protein [Ignavibacteriota bacterium]
MNRLIIVLSAVALSWGLQAPAAFAQQAPFVVYKLEAGSRLWLKGTATIGDYTCEALLLDGMAKFQVNSERKHDVSSPDTVSSEIRVSVFVKNLECGNSAMNADMYTAMKADSFPSIQYELAETTIMSESETADSVRHVRTNGTLTIAGVTKVVPMSITITQLSPTRFHIVGSKALTMHDFDITPPSALWGLIKAHDELVVHFDLIAAMKKVQCVEETTE